MAADPRDLAHDPEQPEPGSGPRDAPRDAPSDAQRTGRSRRRKFASGELRRNPTRGQCAERRRRLEARAPGAEYEAPTRRDELQWRQWPVHGMHQRPVYHPEFGLAAEYNGRLFSSEAGPDGQGYPRPLGPERRRAAARSSACDPPSLDLGLDLGLDLSLGDGSRALDLSSKQRQPQPERTAGQACPRFLPCCQRRAAEPCGVHSHLGPTSK